MCFANGTKSSINDCLALLMHKLQAADAVVVGAGAGLSVSAGFAYSGERFQRYFADFEAKYGFHDMYSGGFYPYGTPEEQWAYWSRYIWINRYQAALKPVYNDLLALVKDKDYFILTTNVDHQFQKAGFDKRRLFYTQGDYGLFQCGKPCCQKTYDNEATIREMIAAQGYATKPDGTLLLPEGRTLQMAVPTELVPHCPNCGRPMTMNLRCDDTFVEDAGWRRATERYDRFLRVHDGQRILFLEAGVGYNTPGIIKYPFWKMTLQNPNAFYACLNLKQALCPKELAGRAVCLEGDTGDLVNRLGSLSLAPGRGV